MKLILQSCEYGYQIMKLFTTCSELVVYIVNG